MLRSLLAAALLVVAVVVPTHAAKPLPVECWLAWEGPDLRFTAINLRDDDYGVGGFPSITGGIHPDENGTLTALVSGELDEVILWRRGGGGALFKPGKQLNDYHPVCVAYAP